MSIKFARCGQQIHTLAKAIDKEENFNFKATRLFLQGSTGSTGGDVIST